MKNAVQRIIIPNSVSIVKSKINPDGPNPLFCPNPMLMRSTKYVNGDMSVKVLSVIGLNNGLMNINGNFIKRVNVIVDEGVSDGGAESNRLNAENEKALIIIAGTIINKFIDVHKS